MALNVQKENLDPKPYVTLEDGKYTVRGNCKYNIICFKDGEYSNCEAYVPFKYEFDGEEEIDTYDMMLDVLSCRVRKDEGGLNFDAELSGACTLLGSNKVTMLEKASFFESREATESEWTVCYVQSEDTAWNIAKRYGVVQSDIKGDPTKDKFVIIER